MAAYLSGLSARALAAQFGIHRSTVAAHLERRGIPRHGLGASEGARHHGK
ncbi:MAG TPA: hypothetical protein VMT43_07290 [Acidimicrobiales bacterium]|nr:hypothetical protein [Acidimicrobiales bacterium]